MIGRRIFYTQVFLGIFLFFNVIMLVFSTFVYIATGRTVKQQMKDKCIGIAVSIAELIKQDTLEYREFMDTLDTNSVYYRKMKASLEAVRRGNQDNIAFLYTETRVSQDEMMYLFDGEPEDALTFAAPGRIEPVTLSRLRAYETRSLYTGDFVTTQWGTLLSVYAPIIDDDTGEFLGIVGADVSKEQYDAIMRYQLIIIIGSAVILALMAAFMLLLFSGRIEKALILDPLTGVYNRSFFHRWLKYEIRNVQKRNIPLVVIMLDLDHFKQINDTYGHPFGDVVLKAVSGAMQSVLRRSDCIARYGGEEFVLFIPGMNISEAKPVVSRIHKAVEQLGIDNDRTKKTVSVTISVGVTELVPGQTYSDVVTRADKAMYEAKRTRNTIVYD
ncbi:MAG: GGDEF domain-containing protein [Spirochaetaceae bacterium]|jgi:diguanylate cyclase (GGDEF)-like protein|nr:GGDEF domain-containing protein [Spirochaetaceae bacterium]